MLLIVRRLLVGSVAATMPWLTVALVGCARSPLREIEVEPDAAVVCQTDADCKTTNGCESRRCDVGLCVVVSRVICDDTDPCTDDSCNPSDGTCVFAVRTPDDDGDGFRAALPGKVPGALDACGSDCNDASPAAHPGAYELCDGVDNDCNGVIDDGQAYVSPNDGSSAVTPVSGYESAPASLTYDGAKFAMTVIERQEHWRGVFHALGADGSEQVPSTPLTLAANDSVAGPLLWTGAVFGTAWEDRREKSYDIYFNRLDATGKKLHQDLRVTSNAGFSIQPSLVYDGTSWALAYADDQDTGSFAIYGQRISKDAQLTGEPVAISSLDIDARQPRLSKNADGLGLFYFSVTDGRYFYQRLDAALKPEGAAVRLSLDEPAETTIRWNGDRYIVAWGTKTSTSVGNAIWGMSLDTAGHVISPATQLTRGANWARSPSIVGFGDRFVLLWADDRYSNGSFELSMQMFQNNLRTLRDQQRITQLQADSLDPVGALGGGALGIAFRSSLAGQWQTYFLALRCWSSSLE